MGTTFGTLTAIATLTLGAFGFQAASQDPVATAPANKRVSATMNDASMDAVLEWLRKTGVNFVIESGSPAARARLNLNINNQPLEKVMDAIASAVGGEWVKHGDVYSLRSGGFPAPPAFMEMPPMGEHEMRAWSEEFAPKIREHLEGLGPEIERFRMELPEMRELGELKELKELELMPELRDFKLHMPKLENIEKLMETLTPRQKELLKSQGHLNTKDLTDSQKKLLEELGSLGGKLRLHQGGEGPTILHPEGGEVIIAPGELMPPVPPGSPAPLAPRPAKWKELSASLTAEQKGLMKQQGWLYVDQLNATQRRLIDLPEGANFTITVSDGKESITIKSR